MHYVLFYDPYLAWYFQDLFMLLFVTDTSLFVAK
jgi:hypothetical protein